MIVQMSNFNFNWLTIKYYSNLEKVSFVNLIVSPYIDMIYIIY